MAEGFIAERWAAGGGRAFSMSGWGGGCRAADLSIKSGRKAGNAHFVGRGLEPGSRQRAVAYLTLAQGSRENSTNLRDKGAEWGRRRRGRVIINRAWCGVEERGMEEWGRAVSGCGRRGPRERDQCV